MYSTTVLELFRHPRNYGSVVAPDITQEGVNPLCGDRLRIEVKLDDGKVQLARFRGDACAIGTAAASVLTEKLSGLSLCQAAALQMSDITTALEADIKPAREKCVMLPLDTLRAGITAYEQRRVTAAVVLAAGAASRFGSQKLLAPLGGTALVRRTVENVLASRVSETVVVLGRDGEGVRRALAGLPVQFVTNADFSSGLSTSLRVGVEALGPSARAAIIVLGDQPGVTADIIDRLIEESRRSGQPIVVPDYAGMRGNPVVFDAAMFDELRAIEGDQGARGVIARDPARVATVCFPFEMPADVDTLEDYARLTS